MPTAKRVPVTSFRHELIEFLVYFGEEETSHVPGDF